MNKSGTPIPFSEWMSTGIQLVVNNVLTSLVSGKVMAKIGEKFGAKTEAERAYVDEAQRASGARKQTNDALGTQPRSAMNEGSTVGASPESGATSLTELAKQAYDQYSKELPATLENMRQIFGETAEIVGRAKEAGSAANRLQRAIDNGWADRIKTTADAIENTWDALGARAVVKDSSARGMDQIVKLLSSAIENGKLTVHKINNLVGERGIPYLTDAHLEQLSLASSKAGQAIEVTTIPYNSGYTGGMVYFKNPSGVHGELQIMGPRVQQLSNLEHIPYDAFLNKPYAGGFTAENLPQASSMKSVEFKRHPHQKAIN